MNQRIISHSLKGKLDIFFLILRVKTTIITPILHAMPHYDFNPELIREKIY